MYFKKIKLGNIFLILAVLYFLGFTSFLGGPYGIAKFFFVIILVGAVIFLFFIFFVFGIVRKIFKNKKEQFYKETIKESKETIKVDAKVVE